ncbi:helix-turn-helix domain-containing protein [Solwaraspora sp. WMMD406]|nr:helix-turn-helix domain-containing protein [Solwaraspora sp. WMMD406]MDG4764113.1 helix-turn-helix domain-containing protein [Solwaraspora sp. WMMD406]
MTARVLVGLFISDSGALTAAELVNRLQVSPASISKSIAFLERIGFVARQRTAGQRRDRYAVDDGLWYRAWSIRVRVFQTWAEAAADGAAVLGPGTSAGDRLHLMGEFFGLVVRDVERITADWQAFLSARGARVEMTRADSSGRPASNPLVVNVDHNDFTNVSHRS